METLAHVFSCESCKIVKSTFFTEHLRAIAFETITKQINYVLKNLSNWLNANKMFLNPCKMEFIMFNPPKNSYTMN